MRDGRDASSPYERAEVLEQVAGQVDQIKSTLGIAGGVARSSGAIDTATDPALVSKVQELVNVAFLQDVGTAIVQATATGDAALVDALHDALVDHVHDELLNRQKIHPAP